MTASLKLSIITPCLNRVGYIADAIASVVGQGYSATEHIVVDGGSTDGTLELLARYPHIRVISGLDEGMYDALNKGLAVSTGEVVGFLNSDDLYAEGAFPDVLEKFRDLRIRAVAGAATVFQEAATDPARVIATFSPAAASLLTLATVGSPFFNAWFFRKSVFGWIGGFNIAYKVAGDREFMLRFALSAPVYCTVDRVVYQYRQHPDAMTFEVTDEKLERIVREHIHMTRSTLTRADLSREARSLIRQASTRDTLRMALRSARNGDLRKMVFFMCAGTRCDPLWGAKLGVWAARRCLRVSPWGSRRLGSEGR